MSFFGVEYNFKIKHLEAWFWIFAIVGLAIFNPIEEGHVSFCVAKKLNFWFCPGCGLGHSIAWIFRGEFVNSFQAHPLGIPTILILLFRSYNLLKYDFQLNKNNQTQ
jgi:hypothetical protein